MISRLDIFVDTALGFSDAALGSEKFGTIGGRHTTSTGCDRICAKRDLGDPEGFVAGFIDEGRRGLGKWVARAAFPGSNWQWRQEPNIASHNTSPEVGLERAIIQHARAHGFSHVANQMPVASGFDGELGGTRCAVDLAVARERTVDLIELKCPPPGQEATQTPLAAAVEILRYLAAYVEARERVRSPAPQQQVLSAEAVRLCVLAPDTLYRRYDMAAFERFLNLGLRAYGERQEFSLSFAFQTLPQGFRAPASDAGVAFAAFAARADCY